MQRNILFSICAALAMTILFASCRKDDIQTKPRVELMDIDKQEVPHGGLIRMNLKAFDKESDVVELWMIPTAKGCTVPGEEDQYVFDVPRYTAPAGEGVEIEVTMSNGVSSAYALYPRYCIGSTDTTTFKIWVVDGEGNHSDTISTPQPFYIRSS